MSAEEPIIDIAEEEKSEKIPTPKAYGELVIGNPDVPVEEMPVFVMVPKTYSEQVIVNPEGPMNETVVSSKCIYRGSQHYKTSLECIPRIEPVHHVNTVLADGDEVTYTDYVYFITRMKPRSFSESVYSHPKQLETKYRTTFTHYYNYLSKWYTTEVDITPAMRLTQSVPTEEECLSPWYDELFEDEPSEVEMLNGIVNGIDCKTPEL